MYKVPSFFLDTDPAYQKAVISGDCLYTPSKPMKCGHDSPMYTKSRKCRLCTSLYNKEYKRGITVDKVKNMYLKDHRTEPEDFGVCWSCGESFQPKLRKQVHCYGCRMSTKAILEYIHQLDVASTERLFKGKKTKKRNT